MTDTAQIVEEDGRDHRRERIRFRGPTWIVGIDRSTYDELGQPRTLYVEISKAD